MTKKRRQKSHLLRAGVTPNIIAASVIALMLALIGLFAVFHSHAANSFVTRCGTNLCLNGQTWQLYGGSIYGFQGDTQTRINLAVGAKLNTVRITNMLDESSTDLANAPYDPTRWVRVDSAIAAAKNANLKVILDLSSYRNLLKNNGQNAYSTDWGPFLNWVTSRINTVTGVQYSTDPTIAIISIAGEVDSVNATRPTGPTSTQELTDFYSRTISELHADDPNHLVSEGGLLQYSWNSGIDWRSIFNLPGDDVPAIHIYSSADEAYVPTIASYAASIGKPWEAEEFGFNQTVGDSTMASDYQRIYSLTKSNNAAGVAFWNVGPELIGVNGKTSTFDVNTGTPLTYAVVQQNAPVTAIKPGDINGDGQVDIVDLSILATHFSQSGMLRSQGDLNGDGSVNITDLSILASYWGT